jgi:hypothetical protein
MVCGVALKEVLGDSPDLWGAGRMGATQLYRLVRHGGKRLKACAVLACNFGRAGYGILFFHQVHAFYFLKSTKY